MSYLNYRTQTIKKKEYINIKNLVIKIYQRKNFKSEKKKGITNEKGKDSFVTIYQRLIFRIPI